MDPIQKIALKDSSGRPVTTPQDWSVTIDRFQEIGLSDVYFHYDYATLNLPAAARVEAFQYQEGNSLFFLPYIVRPIPPQSNRSSLFDFETPYGYSGPLSTTEDSGFLDRAWRALRHYCRESHIICGFIRFHPLLNNRRFAPGEHVRLIKDRETVVVDLPQTETQLLSSYRGDIRYQVRRAPKLGITVEETTGLEKLRAFAKLYLQRMEELGASDEYRFDERYFETIDTLGESRYRLFFASKDRRLIGGLLALFSDRYAHYHLACSLDDTLQWAPNKILLHAFLRSQLGHVPARRIHLGGGRTNDPKDALFQFKSRFSPVRTDFHIGQFMVDPESYARVCAQWEKNYPDLALRNSAIFQRYRLSK